jgi:hypothetical protein
MQLRPGHSSYVLIHVKVEVNVHMYRNLYKDYNNQGQVLNNQCKMHISNVI